MRGNYSYGSSRKPVEMSELLGQKLERQYGQLKILEGRDEMLRKRIQRVRYKVRGAVDDNVCNGSKDYSESSQRIDNTFIDSQLQSSNISTCVTCLHHLKQMQQINQQLQCVKRQKHELELYLQKAVANSDQMIPAIWDNNRNGVSRRSNIGSITRNRINPITIDGQQLNNQPLQSASTPSSSKLSYRRYFTSIACLDSQQEQKQLKKIQQQVYRLKLKQKKQRQLLKELSIRKMQESISNSGKSDGNKSIANLIIDHQVSPNKETSNSQQIHQQLLAVNAINKQLQERIRLLLQQNNTLTQNILNIQSQNSSQRLKLHQQTQQLMNRIGQLQMIIDSLHKQLTQKQTIYSQSLQQITNQMSGLQTLKQELLASNQLLLSTNQQNIQTINLIKSQLSIKIEENLRFTQQNGRLKQFIIQLQTDKQTTLNHLRQMTETINKMSEEHIIAINGLNQQLLITKSNYQQLLTNHQSLKKENYTEKQLIQSLQEQKQSLVNILKEKQEELKAKNQLIQEKQVYLKQKQRVIESSMNIISNLTSQTQQQSNQLNVANNKLSLSQKRVELLQIIELQLRKSMNQLQNQLRVSEGVNQNRLKYSQEERRMIQYERDSVLVENKRLSQEKQELMSRCNQLREQLSLKETEFISITQKMQGTQKQLDSVRRELIETLKGSKFGGLQSQLQLNSLLQAQTNNTICTSQSQLQSTIQQQQHQAQSLSSNKNKLSPYKSKYLVFQTVSVQDIECLSSLGVDFNQLVDKLYEISQSCKSSKEMSSEESMISQLLRILVDLGRRINQEKRRVNDEKNRFNEDRRKLQQFINRQSAILNSEYLQSSSLSSPHCNPDEHSPLTNSNNNPPFTFQPSTLQYPLQQLIQSSKQANKNFSTSSISSVSRVDLNQLTEQQHQHSINKSPQSLTSSHHPKLINMQNILEWNSSQQAADFVTPKIEKFSHYHQNHVPHSEENQMVQFQFSHKQAKKKNVLFVETLSDAASQSQNQDIVDDFASSQSSKISVPNSSRNNLKHKSFLQGYQPTNNMEQHQHSDSNSMTKSAYSALSSKKQYQQNIRNTKLKLKLKSKKK